MGGNRRDFLKNSAYAFCVAALCANSRYDVASAQIADNWKEAFAKRMAKNPWLYVFHSVNQDYFNASDTISVEGKIPKQLNGTLYRNGPALHEMQSLRYHHLFDGDGMVQAYRLHNGQISHLARLVQTTKLNKEREANRRLFSGFGTNLVSSQAINQADDINAANISILHHHDKLFALWEGGSAYEILPDLTTVAPYTMAPGLEGYPFNPHPRLANDGSLWNIGYSLANPGFLLYHIDANGRLIKSKFFADKQVAYVHDFLITNRYVIVPFAPLRFAEFGDNIISSYQWHQNRSMQVLIFNRHDFNQVATFELPPQFIFHYGNAYEDSSGVIHYDAISYDNADIILRGFSDVMKGDDQILRQDQLISHHKRVSINMITKTIKEESLTDPTFGSVHEFPTVDSRVMGRRYQWVVNVAGKGPYGNLPFFTTVTRRNVETGAYSFYRYGHDEIAEEHLYIPDLDKPPQQDGWIIGTTINFRQQKNHLNIFEAQDLAKGPIARATLPYALPLTFHGKFVYNQT